MAAVSGTDDTPLDPALLELLACPSCTTHPALAVTDDGAFLRCAECRRRYPIDDGIPVLLPEEASLDDETPADDVAPG